jgi:hypothetical protein
MDHAQFNDLAAAQFNDLAATVCKHNNNNNKAFLFQAS